MLSRVGIRELFKLNTDNASTVVNPNPVVPVTATPS